jgi:hypothetical protein
LFVFFCFLCGLGWSEIQKLKLKIKIKGKERRKEGKKGRREEGKKGRREGKGREGLELID